MSKVAPLVSVYDAIKKAFDHINFNTPIGCVHQFAGANAPSGWLFCKGQSVLISDYPELYNVIGTIYGESEDEDYFILPNFAGRVPVGHNNEDAYGLSDRVLGEVDGEETHELIVQEMPAHTHTVDAINNGSESISYQGGGNGATFANDDTNVSNTTSSVGGGLAHNIMQPYLVVHYIIKYTHKYISLNQPTYD